MLYPGVRLGTPVLCKDLIYLYKNNNFVIHLNRPADTSIHKVFNSIFLSSEMLKLNVSGVGTFSLTI